MTASYCERRSCSCDTSRRISSIKSSLFVPPSTGDLILGPSPKQTLSQPLRGSFTPSQLSPTCLRIADHDMEGRPCKTTPTPSKGLTYLHSLTLTYTPTPSKGLTYTPISLALSLTLTYTPTTPTPSKGLTYTPIRAQFAPTSSRVSLKSPKPPGLQSTPESSMRIIRQRRLLGQTP
jgi:hypothetical protein